MALIQFKKKDAIKGFEILLHNGQVGVYANNTYSVSNEHLKLLKKAGVSYKEK